MTQSQRSSQMIKMLKTLGYALGVCVGVVCFVYCKNLYNDGLVLREYSEHKVMLVDTSTTSLTSKSDVEVNTIGFFVDEATGNRFRHPIQDKLYREFEKGENKPIPMTLVLNSDDMNGFQLGQFLIMAGGLGVLIGGLVTLFFTQRLFWITTFSTIGKITSTRYQ